MFALLIGFVVLVLAFGWLALAMWLSARADRQYLEREQLQRVFGDGDR
ncbi:MAG TPA: hypothetical protein VEB68_00735 [Croceibacterium sp.]|nr:hypothetical protein [Croceibacterium sp.]